jgi:putative endonuclease
MFYVYILYSLTADKFYVGQTPDVQKRLWEHNNPNENSKFTAKYIPWELVLHFPVSESRADSMKMENFIKSQKSKKFILKLIANKENPLFFDKLLNDII